ncbi:MAG: T9SS type A sorting domain-containing protein [Crocinitomix sp.]|nr:T9SS type A sorting domain-containing protein [Crocinitomix sp.]
MKKLNAIVLFMLLPLMGFCQIETTHWYYRGGEGLDFTSGAPVRLNNGSLGSCEGTAAISDSLGNLLFYTDGETIWDSEHLPMPNGSGLMGDISTVQSAMIVPQPNNSESYYVFTAAQTCGTNGLRYSIIDMNLNSGKGDVIEDTKNTPLLTPVFEKMAAVHHCNGVDVWLMAMKTNGDFYTWLVTENGLCDCPVISKTGPVHEQGWGAIKFSNNGKKLVVTDEAGTCNGSDKSVHTDLYDFDNNSGEVSFYQTIDTANTSYSSSGGSFWGASFSPNNKLLYLSTGFLPYNGSAGTSNGVAVVQYNLDNTNIESSAVLLFDNAYNPDDPDEACGSPMGSLQLGLDGKIYVGNFCCLDVINSPNQVGLSCNYVHNAMPETTGSGYGITNFIESYFGDGVTTCNVEVNGNLCEDDSQVECTPKAIEAEEEEEEEEEDDDDDDEEDDDKEVEEEEQIDIKIYPNPTHFELTIISNIAINRIKISDAAGKTVKVIEQDTTEINVSDLSAGVYFLMLFTENKLITKKFIKV